LLLTILKRLIYRDIGANFKKIAMNGELDIFRDILEKATNRYFEEAKGSSITLASKSKSQQRLSAAQRLVITLYNFRNLYAFVAQRSKKPFFFFLPKSVASQFRISYFSAILSHILFIAYLVNLSLFRFLKASFLLFKTVENLSNQDQGLSVYIHNISHGSLSEKDDNNRAHNLENWLRSHYLKSNSLIFHSVLSLRNDSYPDKHYVKTFLPALSFNLLLFSSTKPSIK